MSGFDFHRDPDSFVQIPVFYRSLILFKGFIISKLIKQISVSMDFKLKDDEYECSFVKSPCSDWIGWIILPLSGVREKKSLKY